MMEPYQVRGYRWGSITTIRGPWFSLGVHVDFQHRCLDVHFIWWIISIGNVQVEWEQDENPNWLETVTAPLQQRDFVRVNDPRAGVPDD